MFVNNKMYKTPEMFSLFWTYMLLVQQQKPTILHLQEYYLQQYESMYVCVLSHSANSLPPCGL